MPEILLFDRNPAFVKSKAEAAHRVAQASNICHDWLVAQPDGFVGEAPEHLLRPLRAAEAELAAVRQAEADRYFAAVDAGLI